MGLLLGTTTKKLARRVLRNDPRNNCEKHFDSSSPLVSKVVAFPYLNNLSYMDMVINFLKYQPTVITPIQLNGIVIERVSSYKLLGVIITNDLSWNEHCDSIHKKATKRLFVLRTLKRVGLGTDDLVLVYCSIVRSIVEYASPVWVAIPLYLDELIESVQRKISK